MSLLRPIIQTGNSANRVDIIFLGDGYTSSDIPAKYNSDIQAYLTYIFNDSALTQPFGRYESFFNIYAIDVVSRESGADDPTSGTVRDTALDATYKFDGVTDRLLYINSTKANSVVTGSLAGTSVGAEMQYVLVNSTKYGGGGGTYGVYAAGNASARDVALHEIGHSFAALADEYGGSASAFTGSEPSAVNVTKDPTGAKWAEWLGYQDPVLGTVGSFQGGVYVDQGIYRPTDNSKMRSLDRPFDPIAREAFIHKFYDLVDPLDGHDSNSGIRTDVATLSVDTIDPTVIKVDWTINGRIFADAGETFDFAARGYDVGRYTVTARSYDPTDMVRGDRSDLEESVTWTVLNEGSDPLFATSYYLAKNPDVASSSFNPRTHYELIGGSEGRDPNQFFDTLNYLAFNPDVKANGINALKHYGLYGFREGRDPGAAFDNEFYLARNTDVAQAGLNPLAHYLEYGQAEGRPTHQVIGRAGDIGSANGFDAEFYIYTYGDVMRAVTGDPYNFALQHFEQNGWREGRNPNAVFDTKGYLATYTDVAAAQINPLSHYHAWGFKEGRDPSADFDSSTYIATYGDVAAAGIDPMQHYLQNGLYEGRSAFADGNF